MRRRALLASEQLRGSLQRGRRRQHCDDVDVSLLQATLLTIFSVRRFLLAEVAADATLLSSSIRPGMTCKVDVRGRPTTQLLQGVGPPGSRVSQR